jgi:hypothetical protein
MDDVTRLEKRIAFLRAHDKKIDETTRRLALIKTAHLKRLNDSLLMTSNARAVIPSVIRC